MFVLARWHWYDLNALFQGAEDAGNEATEQMVTEDLPVTTEGTYYACLRTYCIDMYFTHESLKVQESLNLMQDSLYL